MTRHGPLSMKPFLINLLCEACDERQSGLTLSELEEIAKAHSMRLDDIVSTLVDLVNEGSWRYFDQNGEPCEIDAALKDSDTRLDNNELAKLVGSWRPAGADE